MLHMYKISAIKIKFGTNNLKKSCKLKIIMIICPLKLVEDCCFRPVNKSNKFLRC